MCKILGFSFWEISNRHHLKRCLSIAICADLQLFRSSCSSSNEAGWRRDTTEKTLGGFSVRLEFHTERTPFEFPSVALLEELTFLLWFGEMESSPGDEVRIFTFAAAQTSPPQDLHWHTDARRNQTARDQLVSNLNCYQEAKVSKSMDLLLT